MIRYPWSPTRDAVTYWSATDWDWYRLSWEAWPATGFMAPRAAGWIAGSSIYRGESSPELFLRGADESLHEPTEAE